MSVEPAHRLHTLLHNGKDCWAHTDSETKRYYRLVVERFQESTPSLAEFDRQAHVCDDDDLPDMVRHALTAAKKLAQPALWTYSDSGEAETQAGAA